MRPAGGNHATLRRYALEVWHISVDHFDPSATQRDVSRRTERPLSEVLTTDSTYSRRQLKKRLYREGLKARRCEQCGQDEIWRDRPMALILDHINGVATDNRLENLQIVCPNCAATLDTHCGRNLRLIRACASCGRSFRADNADQRQCSWKCGAESEANWNARVARRSVPRPPYEQLASEIEGLGYCAVGRKYGVSDSAIRKWVRFYERETAREQRGALAEDGCSSSISFSQSSADATVALRTLAPRAPRVGATRQSSHGVPTLASLQGGLRPVLLLPAHAAALGAGLGRRSARAPDAQDAHRLEAEAESLAAIAR